jgi:nitrogen-specific signal transduction histidine kinase/CheY-like chemotaxis protein
MLPNGEPRWLSTWARVVPGPDGKPARMIGAVISIDAYKKAEAALRDSDRRKDEFLAMLAHELRNPLAPITTAAEILRLASGDPARVKQAAEVIGRQVRHVSRLMDELLDVSRVTRGLVQLEKHPVDLASVVHSAVEQAAPALQAKGHALSTEIGSHRAVVIGDRSRLIQVVVNLLNNAARYTPEGGHVGVRLDADDHWATVSVADNGQGIDRDLLPLVFDLFTQGKRGPDRSQGGLGIGLALVKRLVELQGGRVAAQSAGPGKGSTFTVRFPVASTPAAEQPVHAPSAARENGAGLRVVVVDDNRDAAESLGALLTAMGHDVEVHYDAHALLASPTLDDADAFVLDIGLPGMDGHALARALRQRGVTAALIAVTGYGQPSDRERSRAAGFDHHLVKPVEWSALAHVLGGGARDAKSGGM